MASSDTDSISPKSSLKRKRSSLIIQIPHVPGDIPTEEAANNNDSVFFFSDVGVGVYAVKGKRKRKPMMEDAHKIVSSLHGNLKKGFYGVYDGHGGRNAVDFVVENLYENIARMMMMVEEGCGGGLGMEEAVRAGYLKTDEDFLKQGVGSGACCVTALIEENELVVSNLGDCRAVLCRGGVAEALTRDHRADREDERKRIEDKGGYVGRHGGAWRVQGILSVSRSIGDAHLKEWILAEPETRTLSLTSDMEFLVLASDGLWDKVGNQEAIDVLLQLHSVPRKLGEKDDSAKENIIEDYVCISSTCSSPKIRRISLVKQQQKTTTRLSPTHKKKTIHPFKDEAPTAGNFDPENESPSSAKCRRTTLFHEINTTRVRSPIHEEINAQPTSGNLVTACKELANLAVSRGSLDDITVMIIDLSFFTDRIV